ncbi:MAG: PAS domain S-box protein [Alphaproteobacteria bacterium]
MRASSNGTSRCCACTYCSPGLARIFGVTQAKFIAQNASREGSLQSVHPADRDRVAAAYLHQSATGCGFDIKYRLVRPDGEVRQVHATASAINDARAGSSGPSASSRTSPSASSETALRESQARLSAIFDHAPMGIIVKDAEGRYVQVNHYIERLWGTTTQQIQGMAPVPENAAIAHAHDMQVLRTGEVVEQEYSRTVGDAPHVFQAIKFPIHNESDAITGVGAIVLDVTHRRQAEQALLVAHHRLEQRVAERTTALVEANRSMKEAQGRLTDAIESISEGFVLFDADERLVICNTTFRQLYPDLAQSLVPGASLQELASTIGATDVGVSAPQGDGAQSPARQQLRWLGAEPLEQQLADGRWVLVSNHRTREGGIVGIHTEITARKLAERQLRDSEALKSTILQSAVDSIVSIDIEGKVIEWNAAAERTFGYSRSEAIGQSMPDLIVPERSRQMHRNAHAAYVRSGRTGGLRRFFETEAMRKDGSEFPVAIAVHANNNGSHHVITAYLTDLTERRKAEEQLRQVQKMDAVGQLTGGIAHDFNNLLMVVEGYARMAQKHLADEEKASAALEHVLTAADKAANLTRQLLSFSRRQLIEKKVFRADEELQRTSHLLTRSLGELYSLRLDIADEALFVETDPGEFGNAVLNLVLNARDAMPKGGEITIAARAVSFGDDGGAWPQGLPKEGPYVAVEVRDRGHGIPQDTLAHIFEPFFTTKGTGKGTGLGLSMVYGFAHQSGGTVGVDSAVGHGSTFVIYLPFSRARPEQSELAASAELKGKGETILLVEDDADLLELTRETLTDLGYNVLTAGNGFEALEVDEEHDGAIDLVISDVVMPSMGGLELAEMIRETRPDTRVILISGYSAASGDRADGKAGAAAQFLQKPVKPERLAQAVRNQLEISRSAAHVRA